MSLPGKWTEYRVNLKVKDSKSFLGIRGATSYRDPLSAAKKADSLIEQGLAEAVEIIEVNCIPNRIIAATKRKD